VGPPRLPAAGCSRLRTAASVVNHRRIACGSPVVDPFNTERGSLHLAWKVALMVEDSALRRSLDALASFFVGRATMADTLHDVAQLAEESLAGAKFVGLTMIVDNKPATAVFTDAQSPEIDQAQYTSGRGPCLDAFRTGEIRGVRSTKQDDVWPEFSRACVDHGIFSTLSVPLAIADKPLGAMNLYSDTENAFHGAEIGTATLFASQASIVLANSQAYWDARSLGEQLSQSIVSREIIEQAKGIIMGAMRCNAEQAFNYLVQQSQVTNTKLRIVAQDIVDDTTRRGDTQR
jgi:GAF domain-containing protein